MIDIKTITPGKLYRLKSQAVTTPTEDDSLNVKRTKLIENCVIMVLCHKTVEFKKDRYQFRLKVLAGKQVGWIQFDNPNVELNEWVDHWLEEFNP